MATLWLADGVASVGADHVVVRDDAPVPEEGPVALERARFEAEVDALAAAGRTVGLLLEGDAEPPVDLLDRVDFIAVHIPKFTDGRAYSLARLLRDAHDYAGPLVAVGDILRDQLAYLARVGFDRLELSPRVDVDAALSAFRDFSGVYQPAGDGARPRWRAASSSACSDEPSSPPTPRS
jgi:uncharacterized protein (DUF934 family)